MAEKIILGWAVVVHTFNPRKWEVEAGGALWVQGQLVLQSKILDSKGYTEKPCLKKQNNNNNKKIHLHSELLKYVIYNVHLCICLLYSDMLSGLIDRRNLIYSSLWYFVISSAVALWGLWKEKHQDIEIISY